MKRRLLQMEWLIDKMLGIVIIGVFFIMDVFGQI